MEQTQLAIVEQQLKFHSELIEKMSNAIEKLADASTDIMKVLSVHEEKYSQSMKNIELMYEIIHENKKEVHDIKKELKTEINKLEDDINDMVKKTDIKMAYGVGSVIIIFCFYAFTFYQQYVEFQIQTKHSIEQKISK